MSKILQNNRRVGDEVLDIINFDRVFLTQTFNFKLLGRKIEQNNRVLSGDFQIMFQIQV